MQKLQLDANFFMSLAFFIVMASLIIAYIYHDYGTPLTETGQVQPTQEQPAQVQPIIEEPVYSEGKVTERTILIKDFVYEPNALTISSGTKVTWINMDYVKESTDRAWPHGIKIDGITARANRLEANQEFSYVFEEPGTYRFIDTIYPKSMEGMITVVDDQAGSSITGGAITRLPAANPMLGIIVAVIIISIALGYFAGYKEE